MRTRGKPKILMAGPVPHKYGGISKIAGMILDSNLSDQFDLTYVATGTRGGSPRKFWYALSGLSRAVWVAVRRRPDLIHLHVSKGASFIRKWFLTCLGNLLQVPVVLHFHSFSSQIHSPHIGPRVPDFYREAPTWLQRLIVGMLRRATCTVVLSPSDQLNLRTITESHNLIVLPNPVHSAGFGPSFSEPGEHIALFMGDFSLRKGVRDLIAAIPRVAEHVPSARFVLCGSDHNGDIHGAVRIAGVEDFVEMPGFVSGQDKLEWLQRASVFVLPSYAEGMPVAILEAMAVGLPIVTTPVGATPDVVEDGVNGFLIEPGDVSQLAARLIQLLQDENLRREMGQRNREKVLAEYDISVFVDRLSQVYEELAAC